MPIQLPTIWPWPPSITTKHICTAHRNTVPQENSGVSPFYQPKDNVVSGNTRSSPANVVQRLTEMRGLLRSITKDNGPAFTGRAFRSLGLPRGSNAVVLSRASLWPMPASKVSTASSAANVSTNIDLCRCGRPKP